MTKLRRGTVLAAVLFILPTSTAWAQFTGQNAPNEAHAPQKSADGGVEYRGKGEHLTARGRHSLPPGYQETPSTEFKHGPDPDHADNVQRDAVTGADLSHFGSAYSNSSPVQSGQLGDATGNGWVAPR
ncbi:hypothetical protein [Swaminathania salitolerans]|nr:hypothetical protein [Swaminathania salitolerans]GBQ12743.1 hypothetical protein AA21291_1285 [Swaminathania salitolerans LMG 21291]